MPVTRADMASIAFAGVLDAIAADPEAMLWISPIAKMIMVRGKRGTQSEQENARAVMQAIYKSLVGKTPVGNDENGFASWLDGVLTIQESILNPVTGEVIYEDIAK